MKRPIPAHYQVAFLLCACAPFAARAQGPPPPDLTQVSLEDLMNIEVTSVSRKEQKLSRTGASVFVITQDDIHRSGAANIPDVLRMAPGVNVARVDANAWAITIRGFNSRYSNQILLLIDGRSIFSPAFSGVNWDQIAVPLEDIERIEVIRGPGGTAWGANAMNGVINIITRKSTATEGGLVTGSAGSQESGGLAQYGGRAGSRATYRAFGSYSNTDTSGRPAGGAAADGWHAFQEGFRADLEPSPRDTLTVQGDLYQASESQSLTAVLANQLPAVATFNDRITVASGDLQALWQHTLRDGSETSLNAYYNHTRRFDQGLLQDTSFDLDFQHHVALNSRHDLVWGLAYRVTSDRLTLGYNTQFYPPQRTDSLYSVFVQDEIRLADSAWFTLGTKLEHNDYTGFEYEPSAQFVWTPTPRQTVWCSVSRAIRQPSRQDTDIQKEVAVVPLQGSDFGVVEYISNKNIAAEQLLDFEAGYRTQLTKRLSLDLTAFRSYYSNMEVTVPGAPFAVDAPPPHVVFPLYLEDGAHARTYGGEVFATWNLTNRWRLSPGYSLINMSVVQDQLNPNSSAEAIPGDTPRNQIQLRSSLALRSNLNWDVSAYYVGKLTAGQIPSYTRLDVQLRWLVLGHLEVGLTGQNLLQPHHTEFGDSFGVLYTQVQRSILGKITWRF